MTVKKSQAAPANRTPPRSARRPQRPPVARGTQDRFSATPGPERREKPSSRLPDIKSWAKPEKAAHPDYFAFASEPISADKVHRLVERHGSNVMVGIDPTYEGSEVTDRAAQEAGARRHVYLEGPGGPTDGEWDDDEYRRIKGAAQGVGIDTDHRNWMKPWNQHGWKEHTHNQLREFKKQGFESAEIDNLYRGLGDSPRNLVNFYQEYDSWHRQGDVPTLMMKNVDRDQMQAVVQAVESGRLSRKMFSDFHIWEKSAGPLEGQQKLADQLGIRTVVSHDTNHYDAFGAY